MASLALESVNGTESHGASSFLEAEETIFQKLYFVSNFFRPTRIKNSFALIIWRQQIDHFKQSEQSAWPKNVRFYSWLVARPCKRVAIAADAP